MQFKDFAPRRFPGAGQTRFLGLSLPTDAFESFEECVAAASRWIEQNGVQVINIETVVLPNIYHPGEEGTTDPSLGTSGDMASWWYQFVRVWYR